MGVGKKGQTHRRPKAHTTTDTLSQVSYSYCPVTERVARARNRQHVYVLSEKDSGTSGTAELPLLDPPGLQQFQSQLSNLNPPNTVRKHQPSRGLSPSSQAPEQGITLKGVIRNWRRSLSSAGFTMEKGGRDRSGSQKCPKIVLRGRNDDEPKDARKRSRGQTASRLTGALVPGVVLHLHTPRAKTPEVRHSAASTKTYLLGILSVIHAYVSFPTLLRRR